MTNKWKYHKKKGIFGRNIWDKCNFLNVLDRCFLFDQKYTTIGGNITLFTIWIVALKPYSLYSP